MHACAAVHRDNRPALPSAPVLDLDAVNIKALRQFDQSLLALNHGNSHFRLECRAVVPARSVISALAASCCCCAENPPIPAAQVSRTPSKPCGSRKTPFEIAQSQTVKVCHRFFYFEIQVGGQRQEICWEIATPLDRRQCGSISDHCQRKRNAWHQVRFHNSDHPSYIGLMGGNRPMFLPQMLGLRKFLPMDRIPCRVRYARWCCGYNMIEIPHWLYLALRGFASDSFRVVRRKPPILLTFF